MKMRSHSLEVIGVAMERDDDIPCVLLKDPADGGLLSVPVGAFEASSIIIELEGIKPPRPLTHDLFSELFKRHGCTFLSFELYGDDGEGFLGRIRYRWLFRSYSMEVRPSDGIALAIRFDAPILVSEEILASQNAAGRATIPFPMKAEDVLFLDGRSAEARL